MASPVSATQSLRRVLRLEEQRGFSDKAVVGGLDRFLERLAQGKAKDPEIRRINSQGMLGVSYAQLSPAKRRDWVAEVLQLLDSEPPVHPRSYPENPSPPDPLSLSQGRGGERIKLGGTPSAGSGQAPRPPSEGGLPLGTPPGIHFGMTSSTTARQPRSGKKAASTPGATPLDAPVTSLKGVSSTVAPLLERLGVRTVGELLYLFPNRHNDFSRIAKVRDLQLGEEQTVVVTVWETKLVLLGSRKSAEATVGDDTGNIRVVWFNQPYLASSFSQGTRLVLSGKVSFFRGQRVLGSPEYEQLKDGGDLDDLVHTGRLVPVYPTTEGLSPRTVRRLVRQALARALPQVQDFLPSPALERRSLLPLPHAIGQMHYPDDMASWERARERLAFDELFLMQLAILGRRKSQQQQVGAIPLKADPQVLAAFRASLPFQLTPAQERALAETLADIAHEERPMSRLLHGEVGSGKTVVALAALLVAATNGYQGAIMAPTEVLAEQHLLTVARLLGGLATPARNDTWFSFYLDPFPRPITVGLIIGSLSPKVKTEMRQRVAQGNIDILIGTHALIQKEVEMPRLALAVVDEQHRFGVLQRASLRKKAQSTHTLVMSATPIPRTLALTLYGDLDISVIDQLPQGRQPITTGIVTPERRERAYQFIQEQVQEGRQAFVLCPLIEESEALQIRAAVEEHRRLAEELFSKLRLGLIHGQMPMKEKQQVMERFRSGELDILVATPVIEVGIDVPNATVMMIEAAERFGLAQLHQLRGRVGRGEHPGYCLLMVESPSAEAMERLKAVKEHQDGFALAEVDLRLRGPGDYFGTRQSGLPSLRVARLSDQPILAMAREEAQRLLAEDPGLRQHPALKKEVRRYMGHVVEERS